MSRVPLHPLHYHVTTRGKLFTLTRASVTKQYNLVDQRGLPLESASTAPMLISSTELETLITLLYIDTEHHVVLTLFELVTRTHSAYHGVTVTRKLPRTFYKPTCMYMYNFIEYK